MRIFVTGAQGFVGLRLTRRLEADGHTVIGVDVGDFDIVDPDAARHAIGEAGPDAVIHLAALSSVADSFRDPAIVYRVNFLGSRNLLQAIEEQAPSARVLLIGSGDQYAPSAPGQPPWRESDPLRPRSPYARSKAAAEQLGTLAAARGLDVVRVRPFNHTGAGQDTRFVAADFARQVARIEAGEAEPQMRVGNLDSVRDFLHVDDVLEAYLCLLAREVPATIYNIASGHGITIRAVLEMLCEMAGVAPHIEVDPTRFRPTDHMVGDASRLHEATGWKPTIPLRALLEELLQHWRQTPDPAPADS
jgi:GDP-4-dehydro-6-deoxy-D-mannose reductase